jgi:hypothetical protein
MKTESCQKGNENADFNMIYEIEQYKDQQLQCIY